MHSKSAAAALLFGACLALARPALGDTPPSAEDRKAASDAFRDGDRAYKAGDYRHAAEAYHEAYVRAPHYAPLWNEARAWEKGGEVARAANVYAKYLREAPANAPDRNRATAALDRLAKKLARLDIHAASGLTGVTIDGAAVEGESVYVVPGAHVVEAHAGDAVVRQSPSVDAGSTTSVALVAPPPPPKDEPPPPPPEPASGRTWSPVVVYFGGAVAAITTGLAIWSGADTLSQKSTFNASPTQDNLDSGRSKESRTNVLIGVSAGAGLLTAAAAIFLVDWHTSKAPSDAPSSAPGSVTVGVGPGSFMMRGAF